MQKILFITISLFINSFVFAQSIIRLDHSRITAEQLDTKISRLMKEASVTGMAISIFNDAKPVYHKVFGYKNSDTKDPLQTNTNIYGASLSKAVFAVMVMKLVEEKIISLDKPLQDYLPKPVYEYGKGTSWNQDYTSLKEDDLYKKITARHCLSHSSGFANWRWYEPDQKLHVHFEPGSEFSYSGEGLCYLQFVIEKITGRSLNELMQEKLFGPLGMKIPLTHGSLHLKTIIALVMILLVKHIQKTKTMRPVLQVLSKQHLMTICYLLKLYYKRRY